MSVASPLFFFSGGVTGLFKPWLCASAIRLITCGRACLSTPPLLVRVRMKRGASNPQSKDNRQANKHRDQKERAARRPFIRKGGRRAVRMGRVLEPFGWCCGRECCAPPAAKLNITNSSEWSQAVGLAAQGPHTRRLERATLTLNPRQGDRRWAGSTVQNAPQLSTPPAASSAPARGGRR